MKTRTIAGVSMAAALLFLVLIAPKGLTAVIYGVLMAIGSYELLFRTGLVNHPRLVLYSCAMAFAVTMWSFYNAIHAYLLLLLLIFAMALFTEMMVDHVKVRISMLGECFLGGFLVPFLLSAVIRILSLKLGRYFALIPFVIACINDAGAYLVGMRYGKHKLAPVVSPNKTIEGLLGGMGAAVAAMFVYCLILQLTEGFRINYFYAFLYGVVGAGVGAFGDLCFSIIKRQTGIKDYGDLIPGHGGVLDRLDSMMTVAPLIEMLLILLPVAVT
jgi:phosphatidate cytidylyltransferase